MVPTLVPMDTEIKQPIRNRPTTARPPGRRVRPRLTVDSTPPAAVTAPENAPGRQEDQAHGDDVVIGEALGDQVHFLAEVQVAVLEKGHEQGDQEHHNGGHGIKVVEQNAAADVDDQKDPDGQ